MGKVFGILLVLAAIWVGVTIYNEGTENAFGGILAPVESVRSPDALGAAGLTPAAQEADLPAQPRRSAGPITQRVRNRVGRDLDSAARRRGD
jgi:hypothetical protein